MYLLVSHYFQHIYNVKMFVFYRVYPQSQANRTHPNPYHVSYAPVSAQDSELQSLSSDALTDDTMSLTDSSV